MAFTYHWQDIVDRASLFLKGVPVGSTNWPMLCDMVSSDMWTCYPWKDALQNIATGQIPLVDNQQDYDVPTNIYRLTKASIVRTDTTPYQYRELNIETDLDEDGTKRSWVTIQACSKQAAAGQLRLECPVEIPTGVTLELHGEYQIVNNKITALTDQLWFQDHYANVALAGLMYYGYQVADDSRAGTAQTTSTGQTVYTGQLGVYKGALNSMKQAEEYGSNETYYPSESMGSDRDWGWQIPNIYGR